MKFIFLGLFAFNQDSTEQPEVSGRECLGRWEVRIEHRYRGLWYGHLSHPCHRAPLEKTLEWGSGVVAWSLRSIIWDHFMYNVFKIGKYATIIWLLREWYTVINVLEVVCTVLFIPIQSLSIRLDWKGKATWAKLELFQWKEYPTYSYR